MKSRPEIYADRLAAISPEERAELRKMLESPLFVKFLRVAASMKPSANCSRAGSHDRDEFSDGRATARLGEIRGWELHEVAMLAAINEPAEAREDIDSTFPDMGALPLGHAVVTDADVRKHIKSGLRRRARPRGATLPSN